MTPKQLRRLIKQVVRTLPIQRLSTEVVLYCPYCPDIKGSRDETGHLNVNADKKTFHCYRCDKRGTLAAFFTDFGIDYFSGVAVDLAGYSKTLHDWIQLETENNIGSPTMELPTGCFKLLPDSRGLIAMRALNYLKSRKIPLRVLKTRSIQVCALGQYKGRFIFPIFGDDGQLIYWTSRKFMFDGKKTLHPTKPESNSPRPLLYNLDNVNSKTIVLVEGPFDVLRHLSEKAAATLGCNLTLEQAHTLVKRKFRRVIIFWDRDATMKAINTAKILHPLIPTYIAIPPDTRDPAEMDVASLIRCLKGAERFSLSLQIKYLI